MKILINKTILKWVLLITLGIIYGASFILMKRGLEVYSYTQVASLRIFIAFIFFIPVIAIKIRNISWKYFMYILVVGIFGCGIPPFLFTKAQTELSSSLAGMLNSTTVIFTLIIGLVFYKIKVTKINILGVVLGLIGAILMVLGNNIDGEITKNSYYGIFVIMACICYAINLNFTKYKLKEIDSLTISSISFLIIGILSGAYLFTTDFVIRFQTVEGSGISLFYISILGVFGTAIGLVLYNMLIKMSSVLFAASLLYVIPIFAMLFGVLDGETIGLIAIISIILIFSGVYLSQSRKSD